MHAVLLEPRFLTPDEKGAFTPRPGRVHIVGQHVLKQPGSVSLGKPKKKMVFQQWLFHMFRPAIALGAATFYGYTVPHHLIDLLTWFIRNPYRLTGCNPSHRASESLSGELLLNPQLSMSDPPFVRVLFLQIPQPTGNQASYKLGHQTVASNPGTLRAIR